ncbi:uncharacterized protein [Anoplolepis gracilipes]|uniref:uncharacterized protein n=1 Tax=Anoplolepis gracilipes TaxID=354296 RepID=UPI003B9F9887
MCLQQLSLVDDTLEILGMSKAYRRLYNWVIRTIMGWIVLIFFINISDSIWLNYEYFSIIRIFVPFIINHLDHVNIFIALIWGILLRYIGSRFQRINEYIRNLFEDAEHIEKRNKLILIAQQRTEANKCKQYIWIIMHVHLQLCLISHELNKVFNIPMTLKMAGYFLTCVDISRQIYRSYIDKDMVIDIGQAIDNAGIFIFGITHNIIFLTLNYICQTLNDKANETITILYKLSNDNLDKDLCEQILQFILQIKQRELKISGMGLFYFGYDFIRKFYMSVMTILVIIIQMHLPNPYHYIPPINSKS